MVSIRLIKLLLALWTLLLIAETPAAWGERWATPGAIVSVRGRSHAYRVVDSGLSGILQPGMKAKRLAPGILSLKQRRDGVSILGNSRPKPQRYTRKLNLCYRAKTRKMLAKIGGRVRCEANFAYFATATPNDQYYYLQYASSFMSLPAAWDKQTGSNSVIAAVIDTGVLYTHEDLAANMWTNPGEIADNLIDDDGNGVIDDVHGYNAITGSGDPLDDHGHGTHCAGILGARGNNSIGIAGVAWNTKIIGIKFLDSEGSGYTEDAISGLSYITALKQAGVNIVVSNNSWGSTDLSIALGTAIQNATDAGIVFVAAAGNSATNNDSSPFYPANYSNPSIISVASTNSNGNLSSFSNYGATSVDIAAPGSSIPSCYYTDPIYVYMSGTSMAAPQVSGVALLAQSVCDGTLSAQNTVNAILASASFYNSLNGKVATNGMTNASGAIDAALALCPATPTPTPTNTPQSTLTPTPLATSTPVSTETSTAIPTATPTETPTEDPTDIPEPPATATPMPTEEADLPSPPSLNLQPSNSLTPRTLLEIHLSGANNSSVASLRLSSRDTYGRSYTCATTRAPLSDGELTLTTRLDANVRYFKSLRVKAVAGNQSLTASASISNPRPNARPIHGSRRMASLCRYFKRAVRDASTQ